MAVEFSLFTTAVDFVYSLPIASCYFLTYFLYWKIVLLSSSFLQIRFLFWFYADDWDELLLFTVKFLSFSLYFSLFCSGCVFILFFVDSAGGLFFSGCFELVYCIDQGCFCWCRHHPLIFLHNVYNGIFEENVLLLFFIKFFLFDPCGAIL